MVRPGARQTNGYYELGVLIINAGRHSYNKYGVQQDSKACVS